eukprot:14651154-Ditylum_brightwellii.AAC.1
MATAADSAKSHLTHFDEDNNTPCFDKTLKEPLLDLKNIARDQITRRYIYQAAITLDVSKEESISPHDKIATLYSVIAANFPGTYVKEWGSQSRKQTITTGTDLPTEREELQLYVPHEQASFYSIKRHSKVRQHMERFKIYMNPTCITEETSEMLGWFYKSHHKFTSRDEAHAELTLQLDTNAPFDIRAHNVKVAINRKLQVI